MTRRDSPDSVLPNDSIEAPNHPGVSRCLWKEWCHMAIAQNGVRVGSGETT